MSPAFCLADDDDCSISEEVSVHVLKLSVPLSVTVK